MHLLTRECQKTKVCSTRKADISLQQFSDIIAVVLKKITVLDVIRKM